MVALLVTEKVEEVGKCIGSIRSFDFFFVGESLKKVHAVCFQDPFLC